MEAKFKTKYFLAILNILFVEGLVERYSSQTKQRRTGNNLCDKQGQKVYRT